MSIANAVVTWTPHSATLQVSRAVRAASALLVPVVRAGWPRLPTTSGPMKRSRILADPEQGLRLAEHAIQPAPPPLLGDHPVADQPVLPPHGAVDGHRDRHPAEEGQINDWSRQVGRQVHINSSVNKPDRWVACGTTQAHSYQTYLFLNECRRATP